MSQILLRIPGPIHKNRELPLVRCCSPKTSKPAPKTPPEPPFFAAKQGNKPPKSKKNPRPASRGESGRRYLLLRGRFRFLLRLLGSLLVGLLRLLGFLLFSLGHFVGGLGSGGRASFLGHGHAEQHRGSKQQSEQLLHFPKLSLEIYGQ